MLSRLFLGVFLLACHWVMAQSAHSFVVNGGQWPDGVLASAEIAGGKVYIENDGLTYDFIDVSAVAELHGSGVNPVELASTPRIRGHAYKVVFLGSSHQGTPEFIEEQSTRFNYFLGNDPAKWAGGLPGYGGVRMRNVYPGIDFFMRSEDFSLKYDFELSEGADPSLIRMRYDGADGLELRNGRLVITTSVNQVIEQAPIAWQVDDGVKRMVACQYILNGNEIGFGFPDGIDPSLPLIIDPVLLFSTYSGSTADNFGFTATYDDDGYLYAGSSAFGAGYPITLGAYQQVWGGGDGQGSLVGTDIAITKYDVSGTFRIYSTYLGGANDELAHSLIVNPQGELLVMGTTSSPNFPVTANGFQTSFGGGTSVTPIGIGVQYVNGSDIIVSRFSADGSDLLSSTFLGGSANDGVNTVTALKFNYADEFRGEIELDDDGNVYVGSCTFSSDFPVANAFQTSSGGGLDGCITKFTPDLSTVLYSSYYGSSGNEGVYSVDVSPSGPIYLCGGTTSTNLAVTSGSFQSSNAGGTADGFIVRVTADGSAVLQSTYFGSSAYDQCYFVETDTDGAPHIYGQTRASGSSFIINADYGTPNSGMLVAKLDETLSTVTWSTVFGTGAGVPNLSPTAFLVDVCGKIYLSGWGGTTNTNSNPNTGNVFNMDITPDAYQQTTNGSDFYLMVLEDDASDVVYASYFGGGISAEHVDGGTSRFNRKGQIYQSVCAGCGSNDDFPIFPANAVSPTNNSNNCNNGVFKFDFLLPITIADFTAPLTDCLDGPISFTNSSTFGQEFFWDFGDGNTSTEFSPTHSYDEPGTYEVTLLVSNPETCNGVDSLTRTVTLALPQSTTLNDLEVCEGASVTLGPVNETPGWNYFWTPSATLDDAGAPNPIATPSETTEYTLLIDTGICVDTVYQTVEVSSLGLVTGPDVVSCNAGDLAVLTASAEGENLVFTWSASPDFSDPIASGADATSIEVPVSGSSTYYVQITIGECSESGSINVALIADLLDIGADFTVCAGDTVNLQALGELPGYDLEWTPAELVISGQGSASVQVFVPEDGFFELTASSADCTVSDDIFISTSGLDFSQIGATADPELVLAGESSTLTATPPGFDYSWSPQEGLSDPFAAITEATPEETTTYSVTISDGECVYTNNVTVRVAEFICGPPGIYVPNAFTPNGDGNNDVLFVRGNFITDLYFTIYNRWGEMVFETRSLTQGWDGTYNGREVDPAVFVYYLEAFCEGGETYFEKGNITLIR